MHDPVLLKTILSNFSPSPGNNFIDCTAGEGGHTIPLAKAVAPNGKVLAIDADSEQIANLKSNLEKEKIENVVSAHGNFKNLKQITAENSFPPADGILFDFGFSSWHIENSGRGFSFQKNEILDMRYDPTDKSIPTAADYLNSASAQDLEKIILEFGEERFAHNIAREILYARRKKTIETTQDLVNIVLEATHSRGKINPATKTFQALRMVVNNELEIIKYGLFAALDVLKPKGLIATITFHSLEDRLVKGILKEWAKQNIGEVVNKKVIKPDYIEIKRNRRSRSAKLRIFRIL
ncbi:MAG: 16S rRNA (cytosine(1402)-N(4))-methyltransferase [Candidatus Spechtbacteria bacterium RIFCSPLOWO2_12_FULL_38_22]|uniref:Ribosomal RNA small subunit methyltransferase H n=1 Tax=Candidatus Spechtbacteria bacterium RIFCSPLOWO2_12_FULL_38_22 TaxID=1802165 RepID=A0A1G2HH22_9BACT|nr:MAG: 16S rRNA (cytosine(1402)-N(4))-methyltransferase [Candidatus Spechtbacteria bacterium RIFCSPHIGHO2_01_FULL_38_11]OGZ59945.1 MAG: 16S rRNA (cytosine(1402)-N(4))-methyltransferase [Candidatus Spechtbacteria bacterium RIFCSPHIGHO2_12_FULL_38_30]OGZ60952.1 MAG: 16S rRNA (cytosine(1402)-N(4))-methyltransferase [Candidatus Spechtbacteria bacterium RIFCSPLOWO2_01_FULL_38_20]OGZ61805.1 MAG: 16S rRNA (cytosine(1402)-N(4))-methyltransferase [Candidatus Spechtbacteria bacterium RIFCSPLOWO2_12_FULL_